MEERGDGMDGWEAGLSLQTSLQTPLLHCSSTPTLYHSPGLVRDKWTPLPLRLLLLVGR